MNGFGFAALAAAAIFAAMTPPARAAGTADGKREYQAACASCHGLDARGGGPLRDELKRPVPDLTLLSRANKGEFPMDRVIASIDGRTAIRTHGPREMPVWGNSFRLHDTGPSAASRIRLIAEFLQDIQQK